GRVRRARRDPGRLHAEEPRGLRGLLAPFVSGALHRGEQPAPRALRRAPVASDAGALGRENGRQGAAEDVQEAGGEGREGGLGDFGFWILDLERLARAIAI